MARVLHVISSQGLYGAEKVLLTLCKGSNQVTGSAAVAVFRNQHTPNMEVARAAESMGIRVFPIECRGRLDAEVPRRLRDAMQQWSADIAHSHGYKSNLFLLAAARGTTVRTVTTCHGWGSPSGFMRAFTLLDLACLRFFDRVVVVSESMVQRLRRFGVPDSKSKVIANGLELDQLAALPPRSPGPKKIVGLVGRLVIEKGGETLLAAAQQLLRQRRDLEFVFFGDGPLRDALSQRATELGIASSVRFAGRVENMRDVYASLDVLCMPSLTEGLPLTLLEAMAAGVSVVATSVGEIPTVMSGNGILIEVGDARALANGIEQLLSDQPFRERVVAGARAKVMQKYTSSAMVNAYRQLYQELAP